MVYSQEFEWQQVSSSLRDYSQYFSILSTAVIWIVSTRTSTSKSSRPFNNTLVIVPKAPITIGTIVTFMFHSIFNFLARSRYLSFFSHSFSFILRSARTAKSTIFQILFFFFLLIIIRSGLLAEIRWSVCMSKSHRSLCVSFSRTGAGLCIQYHHHPHVVPQARISLTLSRHFSLSFIASGRSSGLQPVSSHSCCMYVRAGRPAFAWPYVGVHRSTSLMSSSLLLH